VQLDPTGRRLSEGTNTLTARQARLWAFGVLRGCEAHIGLIILRRSWFSCETAADRGSASGFRIEGGRIVNADSEVMGLEQPPTASERVLVDLNLRRARAMRMTFPSR